MSAETAIHIYNQYIMGRQPFALRVTSREADAAIEEELSGNDELTKTMRKRISKDGNRYRDLAKEQDVLCVVRYVIRDLLGWDPQDAMEGHLTPEIISALHLDVLSRYVIYPPDVSAKDDRADGYPYMVHRAFPGETKYNLRDRLLVVYDKVRRRELKQFPRYIFRGDDCEEKLAILLNYYLSTHVPASNVGDLYEIFADPARGNRLLRQADLYNVAKGIYDTPLDYLHSALGIRGDDFLYNYYMYMELYEQVDDLVQRIEEGKNPSDAGDD